MSREEECRIVHLSYLHWILVLGAIALDSSLRYFLKDLPMFGVGSPGCPALSLEQIYGQKRSWSLSSRPYCC
ncbi:Hypothetical predicted protein [Octopus vulgaris]|uniref:Uncharacterized protein n=1 Tax=Octopus vulgaris TaxID=6645 RepID=A0AA36AYU9_OCTVU|nr:Hypothetical predicted protein [Octopus vulgaris]